MMPERMALRIVASSGYGCCSCLLRFVICTMVWLLVVVRIYSKYWCCSFKLTWLVGGWWPDRNTEKQNRIKHCKTDTIEPEKLVYVALSTFSCYCSNLFHQCREDYFFSLHFCCCCCCCFCSNCVLFEAKQQIPVF